MAALIIYGGLLILALLAVKFLAGIAAKILGFAFCVAALFGVLIYLSTNSVQGSMTCARAVGHEVVSLGHSSNAQREAVTKGAANAAKRTAKRAAADNGARKVGGFCGYVERKAGSSS